MSLGTVFWNVTEYVCYLCIILNTSLSLLGMLKGGTGSPQSNDGMATALNLLKETVQKLDGSQERPVRKTRNH